MMMMTMMMGCIAIVSNVNAAFEVFLHSFRDECESRGADIVNEWESMKGVKQVQFSLQIQNVFIISPLD